ncbi:hypothetical protein C8Q72DRAFT_166105 [Fomitopsis betulina]|nr:hypothetical protein C8Q72DRAFT_166105 [Fomitopsis betulina]
MHILVLVLLHLFYRFLLQVMYRFFQPPSPPAASPRNCSHSSTTVIVACGLRLYCLGEARCGVVIEPGDRSVIWGSAHSDDVEHCSPSPRACIDPETERLQDYLTGIPYRAPSGEMRSVGIAELFASW